MELTKKTKTGILVASILVMALIGICYVILKEAPKSMPNTSNGDNTSSSTQDEATTKTKPANTDSFEVKAIKGYTAYVIKYVDTEGKAIPMTNKIDTIRNGNYAYNTLNDAKKAKIFEDYYDNTNGYYFQIKTGSTLAWRVTPIHISEIPKWSDSKGNILIAVNPNDSMDGKTIEYDILIDYSADKIQPTFNQTVK